MTFVDAAQFGTEFITRRLAFRADDVAHVVHTLMDVADPPVGVNPGQDDGDECGQTADELRERYR